MQVVQCTISHLHFLSLTFLLSQISSSLTIEEEEEDRRVNFKEDKKEIQPNYKRRTLVLIQFCRKFENILSQLNFFPPMQAVIFHAQFESLPLLHVYVLY